MPSYRKRSRSRKSSYRKRRGSASRRKGAFAARVKKVIMKVSETKYRLGGVEDQPLYHDRGAVGAGVGATTQGALVWNPWNIIEKGTEHYQRAGDEIYPRGMSFRMSYWCAADRQAQFVRIIVAVIPKIYRYPGGGAPVIQDGTNMDLFDPMGMNDCITSYVVGEGVKVLYDKVQQLKCVGKSEDADQKGDQRFFKKFYIKSRRGGKLKWANAPDNQMVNKPVGVWVIPYDDYGTLRTDILGHCTYSYKLYWKDV